jgi:flagellar biosynthesis/type III secretory pathway protein FliH
LTFRLQEGCAEVDRLKSVLHTAITQFETARQQIVEQSEAQLIELALALAERLAAQQLQIHPGHVQHLVVEGLEALSSNDESVVRLGSDFASVVAEVSAYARDCGLSCRVLCDEHLQPDAVSIQSELGSVDESLRSRLSVLAQSVRQELGT